MLVAAVLIVASMAIMLENAPNKGKGKGQKGKGEPGAKGKGGGKTGGMEEDTGHHFPKGTGVKVKGAKVKEAGPRDHCLVAASSAGGHTFRTSARNGGEVKGA